MTKSEKIEMTQRVYNFEIPIHKLIAFGEPRVGSILQIEPHVLALACTLLICIKHRETRPKSFGSIVDD